jgi:hypothetical protein
MNDGMTVALTSYALAAAISLITAALMALILKVVQAAARKRQ